MIGHVDSETLAAFREGLLPRRKAGQVAAHVARCAQCAGLDAQLAEVPALLARSPAPPMPAALTARIEAALAAEAAARSATAEVAAGAADSARDAAAALRRHRKTRAPGSGRSRLALRIAVAAAAVVVLGGGGYGLSRLLAGSGNASLTTSAPENAPQMGGAAPRAATGSGAAGEHSGAAGAHRPAPSNGLATSHIVHSGTNYQPGRMQTQVRATLARFGPEAKLPAPSAPPRQGVPSAVFVNLSACLQRFAGGQRPELVDEAYYEGKPAAIIVLPGAGPNTLRVLVVGTRCSAGAPGPIFSRLLPSGG